MKQGKQARAEQLSEISLELIDRDPKQPRKTFRTNTIERLAASIKKGGLSQPISVKLKVNGRYLLVMGERRLRAMRLLGWKTAKCLIYEGPQSTRVASLVENAQREDLNPMDFATACREFNREGMSWTEIADSCGLDVGTVRLSQKLFLLDVEVQAMVRDGLLPKRQALRLRQFGGQKKRQIEAALDLIEGNEPQALTVSRVRVDRKKIESTVARLTGEPADWVKRVQDLSQRTASVTAAMVALMTLDPETRYKTWNSVGKPVKNRILANSSALAKVLDDFVRTFRNLKLPVKPVESKVIVDKPKSGKDKTRKKTARQATLNVSTATRVIRVLDAVFGKSENRRTVNLGLSNIRGRIGSDLTDSQLRKQVVGAFAVFKEYWNTPVSSTSLQWRKALFGRFTEIRRQFGFHHTAANFSEFVKDLQARSRASDAVQLTRFTDEH